MQLKKRKLVINNIIKPLFVMGLCFWVGILTASLRAQACDSIRVAAAKIGDLKDEAEIKNMELLRRIERLNEELPGNYRIKIPNSKLKNFDDSDRRYHNDRDWVNLCPNWTKDWGLIKDFRETNYDKFVYQNRILEKIKNDLEIRKNSHEKRLNHQKSAEPAPNIDDYAPFDFAERTTVLGKTFSYCIVDPAKVDLRIHYQTPHSFLSLREIARRNRQSLVFAVNGGMFHSSKKAVGLLVAEGQIIEPINRRKGEGNFYLNPNGVFGVLYNGFPFIYTTRAFLEKDIPKGQVKLANQSGPMLIINGKINRLFKSGSTNVHFRNGVGVRKDGTIVFAISEQMVNFYQLASLFQKLGCNNALYLDGTISRMYLPKLNKTQDLENSSHLGPIFYIFENSN